MHLEAGRVHDVSTIGQRWQSSGTGCSLGGSASGSFGPDARRDQLFLGLDLGGKILVELPNDGSLGETRLETSLNVEYELQLLTLSRFELSSTGLLLGAIELGISNGANTVGFDLLGLDLQNPKSIQRIAHIAGLKLDKAPTPNSLGWIIVQQEGREVFAVLAVLPGKRLDRKLGHQRTKLSSLSLDRHSLLLCLRNEKLSRRHRLGRIGQTGLLQVDQRIDAVERLGHNGKVCFGCVDEGRCCSQIYEHLLSLSLEFFETILILLSSERTSQ